MVAGLLAALLATYAGAAAGIARVPARVSPALGAPAAGVSWSGGTLPQPRLGAASLAPSLPVLRVGKHSTWDAPAAIGADATAALSPRAASEESILVHAEASDYSREQFGDDSARAEPVDNPEVPLPEGSARAAARAQETLNAPLAPSVEAKTHTLGTLFDGSKPLPSGEVVLGRASRTGVGRETLAKAISDAGSLEQALAAIRGTGVLSASERGDAARARLMLLRVWHEVADAVPADSLTVQAAGILYHIHPVVHGQAVPLRAGAVRRLVRRLQDAGASLLSEQDLGRFYGFTHGWETRDHEAAPGAAAEVSPQPALARRSMLWAYLLGPLALLVWRLLYARLARAAAREGDADLAHWLRARARALFSRRLDWAAVRRTELPAALTLEEGDWTATRSSAMAAAAAALAAARGHSELHLLVGHKHARQLALLLARGPRPRA